MCRPASGRAHRSAIRLRNPWWSRQVAGGNGLGGYGPPAVRGLMRVQSGGVQRCRHLVGHAAEDPTTRRFPVHRWRWEPTLKRTVGRPRSPWSPAQTVPVERSGEPSPCPVALHRARRHRHAPSPAPAIQPHEARRARQRIAAARRHPALTGVILKTKSVTTALAATPLRGLSKFSWVCNKWCIADHF